MNRAKVVAAIDDALKSDRRKADQLIEEALVEYPGSFQLWRKYAVNAESQGDWRGSWDRWFRAVQNCNGRSLTAEAYRKAAKHCHSCSDARNRKLLLTQGLQRFPEDPHLLIDVGRLYREEIEVEQAESCFLKVLSVRHAKTLEDWYKIEAAQQLKKIYRETDGAAAAKSFEGSVCASEPGLNLVDLFAEAEKADPHLAQSVLGAMGECLGGLSREVTVAWQRALELLEMLCSVCTSGRVVKNPRMIERLKNDGMARVKSSRKLVCVCGMGYSGSGAVYDFFADHRTVSPIDFRIRPLVGRFGLHKIAEALSTPHALPEQIVGWVVVGLLGVQRPAGFAEALGCMHRRRVVRDKSKSIRLANALSGWLIKFVEAIIPRTDLKLIYQLNTEFLCDLAQNQWAEVVLADQVVRLAECPIERVDLLAGANFFFVFRDPRSNYVNLRRRREAAADDVFKYIELYRTNRSKFRLSDQCRNVRRSRIAEISFEKFVMSDAYRSSIAAEVGISSAELVDSRKFQPSVSIKKVYEFKQPGYEKEVAIIEEQLSEFVEQLP